MHSLYAPLLWKKDHHHHHTVQLTIILHAPHAGTNRLIRCLITYTHHCHTVQPLPCRYNHHHCHCHHMWPPSHHTATIPCTYNHRVPPPPATTSMYTIHVQPLYHVHSSTVVPPFWMLTPLFGSPKWRCSLRAVALHNRHVLTMSLLL